MSARGSAILLLLLLAGCWPPGYGYIFTSSPDPFSTTSLAVSPLDANAVLAVHAYAIERTTDGGLAWGVEGSPPPSFFYPIFGFASVAATPSPSVFYATSTVTSSTVWKSMDGGLSFAPIASFAPSAALVAPLLAVDPANASHVVLGSGGSLFVTNDGGNSWSAASIVSASNPGSVAALAIDSVTPGNVYAGLSGNANGTLLVSHDGGATYSVVGVLPTASVTLLVVGRQAIFIVGSGGVYRSSDRGASWTQAMIGGGNFYASALAVAPGNSQTVYVLGQALYRSVDGGVSYSLVYSFSLYNTVLALAPSNVSVIYVAGAHGVLRSTDGGATFVLLPPYDYVPIVYENV